MAGYFFYFINANFLIPKLLRQKGVIYYLVAAVGVVFLFYPLLAQLIIWLPLHQQTPILLPSENYNALDPINATVAFSIMVLSLPITLALEWFKQNNEIISLEKQQVETELSLLKQQINPHFFFNTLNNLYALSLSKSEKTPEVILQLSELMQYVIYKGQEQQVLLTEDVQYMNDYIKLQKLRIHQPIDLQFEQNITDYDIKIAPLLLIILVENAFKHGVETSEQRAYLHITINADADSLCFSCINSFEQPSDHHGIGLENLKRRLSLLYPDSHELILEKRNSSFEVALKITFN